MPIYGKKDLKLFITGTESLMTLKLGMQHLGLWFYLVYSNDDRSLILAYLQQGQFESLRLLYGKKAKQWDFSSPELKGTRGVYRIVISPLSVFVGCCRHQHLSSHECYGPWTTCLLHKSVLIHFITKILPLSHNIW